MPARPAVALPAGRALPPEAGGGDNPPMAFSETRRREAFRRLPAVDQVLRRPAVAALLESVPREVLIGYIHELLDDWRREIRGGVLDADGLEARVAAGGLEDALGARVEAERRAGLVRAINATGVVLNTGLGRAPVHREAAARMAEVAGSYCVLEVERESGERGRRDARLGELLARLSGAEAGIAVNNNAGAVLLLLSTFARGGDAIVSRGELVEIGGSFRMPAVMEAAGVRLVEVGTTNRTRIEDYAAAITRRTGLLLKVHTSNFRVVGFTEEVDARALAALGAERGIPTAFDLGSGLLDGPGAAPLDALPREPRVAREVASGIDVVTFSGDKLLGGPQAGLLVGKREAIERLRRNPVYRAVRLDKTTLAGLEATLELYLAGRADQLPVRRMLRARAEDVRPRAEKLAAALAGLEGLSVEVIPERSQPGSGAAPDVYLDTFCLALRAGDRSAAALARALRLGDPPVFSRIQDERLLLDPRTLLPGEEAELVAAVRAALAAGTTGSPPAGGGR